MNVHLVQPPPRPALRIEMFDVADVETSSAAPSAGPDAGERDATPTPVPSSPAAPPRRRLPHPFAGGTVELAFEFQTAQARRLYRREFAHLGHLLNGLQQARSFRGVDPAAADHLEDDIRLAVDVARGRIDTATLAARQALHQHPLASIAVHYAQPLAVKVPIGHPFARDYLDTLALADRAFADMERAWLFGLLDTRERRQQELEVQRAIRGIVTATREAYSTQARRLRRLDRGAAPLHPQQPAAPADASAR